MSCHWIFLSHHLPCGRPSLMRSGNSWMMPVRSEWVPVISAIKPGRLIGTVPVTTISHPKGSLKGVAKKSWCTDNGSWLFRALCLAGEVFCGEIDSAGLPALSVARPKGGRHLARRTSRVAPGGTGDFLQKTWSVEENKHWRPSVSSHLNHDSAFDLDLLPFFGHPAWPNFLCDFYGSSRHRKPAQAELVVGSFSQSQTPSSANNTTSWPVELVVSKCDQSK